MAGGKEANSQLLWEFCLCCGPISNGAIQLVGMDHGVPWRTRESSPQKEEEESEGCLAF